MTVVAILERISFPVIVDAGKGVAILPFLGKSLAGPFFT